jgi:hypothetical protein
MPADTAGGTRPRAPTANPRTRLTDSPVPDRRARTLLPSNRPDARTGPYARTRGHHSNPDVRADAGARTATRSAADGGRTVDRAGRADRRPLAGRPGSSRGYGTAHIPNLATDLYALQIWRPSVTVKQQGRYNRKGRKQT